MADDPFLARFAWHPEPELIGMRDAAASRESMRAAGAATWEAALDYLYDHALVRAMGEPADAATLRASHYAASGGGPGPAPESPTPLADLLDDFRARVAPHTVSAYHPRSYGYFTPPPLVASVLGEVLSQVAQQGVDVWHAGPVAAYIEEEVVRWLCDLVGYGRGSFGLLTSGGVMANFVAMALVRDVHLPRVRAALGRPLGGPPRGSALEGVRIYTSDQTHFSIARAIDELGFPPETLAVLPADGDFRLRAAAVAEAVALDRADGLTPLAISAVAGATNTGSIDALDELADLAAAEGLWFHIDGAYGAAVRFSARDRDLVSGLGRADSVTVDPHKWMFQAYDIGGLVVRDGAALGATFGGRRPEYYRHGHGTAGPLGVTVDPDGATDDPGDGRAPDNGHDADDGHGPEDPAQLNFWKLGFEGTRRWRALKLWLSWRHVGSAGFARLVEANLDVARHLARRIAESDDFEACPAEPALSVVCFRHLPGGRTATRALAADDPHALDAHQDRLQQDLERSGRGWLSTTRLRGATWLRAGVLNSQATEADADDLLDVLRELAAG